MNDYTSVPGEFLVPLSHRNRSYRLVQLRNGLVALLISDPAKCSAAAALCVATGSNDDPSNIPGLAHLVEHMVFMGTKSFPKPDYLQELVYQNNGLVNAYTTNEKTCFHWEIPSTGLIKDENPFELVLKVFASFFKDPIFNAKYIRSEILNVNSEHFLNLKSLDKKFYHSLKILSNRAHPFHKFGTGDESTLHSNTKLLNLNLKKEAALFFKLHYIANNMTLVLKGPQSLNFLAKLAIANFIGIPREPKLPVFPSVALTRYDCNVFSSSNTNKLLRVESANDSKLRMIFPLCKLKSHPYIEELKRTWVHLLGEESKNSLCDHLINEKFWSTSIIASTQNLTYDESVLIIEISLTLKGRNNLENLIIEIFSFLYNVLFVTPASTISSFLHNISIIDNLNYLHQDLSVSSVNEVTNLSETLLNLNFVGGNRNLIKGFVTWGDKVSSEDYLSESWWASLAEIFLSTTRETLSLSNFNLILIDSNLPPTESTLVDEYYHFKYLVSQFDPLYYYTKLHPSPISFSQSNFFADQFNLNDIYNSLNSISSQIHNNPLSFIPQPEAKDSLEPMTLYDHSGNHELWYHKANSPNKMALSFKTQLFFENTAKLTVGIEILCDLIGTDFKTEFYPAEQVGCSWGLYPCVNSTCSILVTICGLALNFVQFLTNFIQKLLQNLQNVKELEYQTFKKSKVKLRKKYENILDANGISKIFAASYVFLEEKVWTLDERIDAFEEIEIDDLINISGSFLNGLSYTTILITSPPDFDETVQILKIINLFTNHEKLSSDTTKTLDQPSSYLLPRGFNYTYQMHTTDPSNIIFYYVQIGENDCELKKALCFLTSYFISQNISNELRTKRQLGYSIISDVKTLRRSLGIHITIASEKYLPAYLKTEIESYLEELNQMISFFTNDEFSQLKNQFLITHKSNLTSVESNGSSLGLQPSISSSNELQGTLYDFHKLQWEKIMNKNYEFSKNKRESEIDYDIVRGLTQNDMEIFFREFVSPVSDLKRCLSLFMQTKYDIHELTNFYLKKQLQIYLDLQNIQLSDEEIENIVEKCNGSPIMLPKEIFKVLRKKDISKSIKYFKKSYVNISKSSIASFFIKQKHNTDHIEKSDDIELKSPSELHENCEVIANKMANLELLC